MQQQFRGYAPAPPHGHGPPRGGGGQHGVPQRRGGIGPMMSAGPHHSVPMTQAQILQENQRREMATQLAKLRSRKPTDKSLPDGVEEILVDGGEVARCYKNLRDYERRLDATMTRKRLDIQDAVNRPMKRNKTLRISISNTVEDQFWQANNLNVDSFDFSETLESTYRVTIQGQLLDDDEDDEYDEAKSAENKEDGGDRMETDTPNKPKPKPVNGKPGDRFRFSHFFKSLTVDLERPKPGRPTGETIVEWKKPDRTPAGSNLPAAADFDQFSFKRNGDENINIVINLYRHEDPEKFELSPELAEVIDMREATRQEAATHLWDYIKFFGLQEDEEKRNFRCDDLLKKVVGRDSGHIPMLNDYIHPHLKPLPPHRLPYTIRVDEEFHKSGTPMPTIYDITVEVDDPLKAKMQGFLRDTKHAAMLKEVAAKDDQLATIMQAVAQSKAKHMFLTSMGKDPVNFVKTWLSSQKRDLEVIMGESTRGGGEDATGDEWRRGGKDSIWATDNARESVAVLLSKQPVPR